MKNLHIYVGLLVMLIVFTAGTIDLDHLFDYSSQEIPAYADAFGIHDDEPDYNRINDTIATLGRVLFYDKKLSSDNTIAYASCHKQANAFGDTEVASQGVNGTTNLHAMRLVNVRNIQNSGGPFDIGFFWDQRDSILEEAVTKPIEDHIEMGNSGQNGAPDFDDVMEELEALDYYQQLFTFAFGDSEVTRDRIGRALAQFLRSIMSYDSKFDQGMELVADILEPFPNFTEEENLGKALFIEAPEIEIGENFANRIGGGLGCATFCHVPGNFSSASEGLHNGVITEIDGTPNLQLTKSPTLRDLFNPQGEVNGPMFANGKAATFEDVLNHYNDSLEVVNGIGLGFAFFNPEGNIVPTRFHMTEEEKAQVTAFVKTLTGQAIYTDEKWSNPFDEDGNIDIVGNGISFVTQNLTTQELNIFPNPATSYIRLKDLPTGSYMLKVHNLQGQEMLCESDVDAGRAPIGVAHLPSGVYSVSVFNRSENKIYSGQFVKH